MTQREDLERTMERLVAEYGDELLRLCFMYLSDYQMAEDAWQETFIKVYRRYGTFAGRSSERTWLVRIAINVCKDYLRASWLRRVDCYGALAEVSQHEGEQAYREQDESLLLAVLALPVKYREVILLYYYWGLDTAELARLLHRPVSTMTTRLRRARAMLKEQLEKEAHHDE